LAFSTRNISPAESKEGEVEGDTEDPDCRVNQNDKGGLPEGKVVRVEPTSAITTQLIGEKDTFVPGVLCLCSGLELYPCIPYVLLIIPDSFHTGERDDQPFLGALNFDRISQTDQVSNHP